MVTGNDLASALMKRGLLTKATHENSVRLAPSLNIKEDELMKALRIIKKGVNDIKKLNKERKEAANPNRPKRVSNLPPRVKKEGND
jgi:hypothetical protein